MAHDGFVRFSGKRGMRSTTILRSTRFETSEAKHESGVLVAPGDDSNGIGTKIILVVALYTGNSPFIHRFSTIGALIGLKQVA
jgi:hypothetical protein